MSVKTRKEWIIGETTVGGAFITLANPGAVTWARINADNTITTRTAAQTRTDLGLGTAAVENTGTSGHTIPFLDGANTWSAAQTFSAGVIFSGTASNITLGSNWLSGDGTDEGVRVDATGQVVVTSLTTGAALVVQSIATQPAYLILKADSGDSTKSWAVGADNTGNINVLNEDSGLGISVGGATGNLGVDGTIVAQGNITTNAQLNAASAVITPAGGAATLNVIGKEGSTATLNLVADDGDDPSDTWAIGAQTNGRLTVGSSTGTVTFQPSGAISTNAGEVWDFGAVSAGAPTPDVKIRVTINGVAYDISAEAV